MSLNMASNSGSGKAAGLSGIVVKTEKETDESGLFGRTRSENTHRNNLVVVDPSVILVKVEMDESELNIDNNRFQEETEEKLYQCGACKGTFMKYDDLKKHVKKVRKIKNNEAHPNGLTSFSCMVCKKSFPNTWKLHRHVNTHIDSYVDEIETNSDLEGVDLSTIEVKAEIDQNEAELNNLQVQLQPNKNVEERLYQCGACEKTFHRYDDLKVHALKVRKYKKIETHPHGLTTFNCTKCKKSYDNTNVLYRHMIVHNGEKIHECPECSKRFLRKENMTQHLAKHLVIKPFRCEVCLRRFAQKEACNRHMRTHTGEKPFECHICHLCFGRQCTLNDHVLIHSAEMNFKCAVCGKLSKTRTNHNKHMVTHRGVKNHKCFKCDMKFYGQSQRERHERIHLKLKPYECTECKMRFTRSDTLTNHMRTHTGEKRFKCELCGQAFTEKRSAINHTRIQKNKPVEKRCDYKTSK